ncbi:hypothetical protein [Glutamicibacter sp. NPDC087344]|uniref:hypothetical protein n=1 Tax=Glutamicibacter sp. NPDC087344 TaxID=3363994 RepID=UPI00380EFC77
MVLPLGYLLVVVDGAVRSPGAKLRNAAAAPAIANQRAVSKTDFRTFPHSPPGELRPNAPAEMPHAAPWKESGSSKATTAAALNNTAAAPMQTPHRAIRARRVNQISKHATNSNPASNRIRDAGGWDKKSIMHDDSSKGYVAANLSASTRADDDPSHVREELIY